MTRMLTPGGVSIAAVRQQMERQKFEARHAPRMIFAMDATGSREPTWEMAGKLHREMGAALGSLTLQLVFFGGTECKASGWVTGGQRLAELMTKVRCATGYTQIGRVLRHVLTESGSTRSAHWSTSVIVARSPAKSCLGWPSNSSGGKSRSSFSMRARIALPSRFSGAWRRSRMASTRLSTPARPSSCASCSQALQTMRPVGTSRSVIYAMYC